jgi:hypothetical protein
MNMLFSWIFLGNALYIKIGDKEVEYNADFRFYITTKLSNPHYTPEISTKALIVNFAVKEQGICCDECLKFRQIAQEIKKYLKSHEKIVQVLVREIPPNQ